MTRPISNWNSNYLRIIIRCILKKCPITKLSYNVGWWWFEHWNQMEGGGPGGPKNAIKVLLIVWQKMQSTYYLLLIKKYEIIRASGSFGQRLKSKSEVLLSFALSPCLSLLWSFFVYTENRLICHIPNRLEKTKRILICAFCVIVFNFKLARICVFFQDFEIKVNLRKNRK